MTAVSLTLRLDINKFATLTYYKPRVQPGVASSHTPIDSTTASEALVNNNQNSSTNGSSAMEAGYGKVVIF